MINSSIVALACASLISGSSAAGVGTRTTTAVDYALPDNAWNTVPGMTSPTVPAGKRLAFDCTLFGAIAPGGSSTTWIGFNSATSAVLFYYKGHSDEGSYNSGTFRSQDSDNYQDTSPSWIVGSLGNTVSWVAHIYGEVWFTADATLSLQARTGNFTFTSTIYSGSSCIWYVTP